MFSLVLYDIPIYYVLLSISCYTMLNSFTFYSCMYAGKINAIIAIAIEGAVC